MHTVHKMKHMLQQLAEHFGAFLLGSMFFVFVLQIAFRYFLNLPVGWTVEWVTIAWLWVILFTFAFIIPVNDMIRLDIVYSAVPRSIRQQASRKQKSKPLSIARYPHPSSPKANERHSPLPASPECPVLSPWPEPGRD